MGFACSNGAFLCENTRIRPANGQLGVEMCPSVSPSSFWTDQFSLVFSGLIGVRELAQE